MPDRPPLIVEQGTFSLYYCFDVGEEIELDKIEKIFGEAPTASRLVYERLTPAYVQYRRAPLLVELGSLELQTGKNMYRAECRAKLYDFGVITIIFRLLLRGPLHSLMSLSAELIGNPQLYQAAQAQLERLRDELKRAIVQAPYEITKGLPGEPDWEDYAIFYVQRFDRPLSARELLPAYGLELARILRSETEPLSDSELADAVKQALSYYEDELAVIDWNATFLYDTRHSYDLPDVLEYAVILLLELRTYDTVLDRVLDRAYDDLARKRRTISLRPFASTIDYLSQVKLDVSEVIEKVTNSLKLIGDPYLAKVYNATATRFYLATWQGSLGKKLDTVEDLYALLHDRTQTRRMLILEILIVLLFVLDIFLLFVEPLLLKR
jgi:hypothetical protein